MISSLAERPLQSDCVAFGEIALSGEIRPVAHSALRCREAAKLGFGRALGPSGAAGEKGTLALSGFRNLGAFVDHLLGR